MEIGFIGLGKLGMPCAEVMATKHNVTGYDIAMVNSNSVNITQNIEDTVMNKDFTFIAIQTPHDPNYDGSKPSSHLPTKDFDYSHVINVLKQISKLDYESTIVLISTVLPGTTRKEFSKYLKPHQFIYNPYLIAMGTVAYDMVNPEMIIIGSEDGLEDEVSKLISFYDTICNCNRYVNGTWDEAESIKIFYNTFISMKLSIANMVLDVAEKNGNINADVVMDALGDSTKRIISKMYLKSGMGDGGPCHPRDNIALSSLADNLNLGYDLFKGIMQSREQQANNLAKKLMSFKNPVVILGKSYKPGVDFIDGSYSLLVGHYIQRKQFLCFYDNDPEINGPYTYLLGHRGEFFNYNFKEGSIIVDPWGEIPEIENCEIIKYGRQKYGYMGKYQKRT